MSKMLLMSDLHITDKDDRIIGLDPLKRFQDALTLALANHSDAESLVLLGDLTHHGQVSEYIRLKSVLETCPLPIRMTLGNHDTRAGFGEVFGQAYLPDGFASQSWVQEQTLFLLIDTVDEDKIAPQHGGYLCERRLAWISDQIASANPTQVIAMMHHLPFKTGFDGMDDINLLNGDALLDLLQSTGLSCQLICGHIHRTISGNIRGCPFSVLKSPCHQMPMKLGDVNTALSANEPGGFGILLTYDQGAIVHTEDVLDTPANIEIDSHSK